MASSIQLAMAWGAFEGYFEACGLAQVTPNRPLPFAASGSWRWRSGEVS